MVLKRVEIMVEGGNKEEGAQGPFTIGGLQGHSTTLAQLKEQLVHQLQSSTATATTEGRWIIGKKLAHDDTQSLAHYGLNNQQDVQQQGLIFFYILGRFPSPFLKRENQI